MGLVGGGRATLTFVLKYILLCFTNKINKLTGNIHS